MHGEIIILQLVFGKDTVPVPKLFLQFLYHFFSEIIHSFSLLLTICKRPAHHTPSS